MLGCWYKDHICSLRSWVQFLLHACLYAMHVTKRLILSELIDQKYPYQLKN